MSVLEVWEARNNRDVHMKDKMDELERFSTLCRGFGYKGAFKTYIGSMVTRNNSIELRVVDSADIHQRLVLDKVRSYFNDKLNDLGLMILKESFNSGSFYITIISVNGETEYKTNLLCKDKVLYIQTDMDILGFIEKYYTKKSCNNSRVLEDFSIITLDGVAYYTVNLPNKDINQ